MSALPAADKKKTERSQVSASTAFNDTRLRKSPGASFPRDGSMVSSSNLASVVTEAKSPRAKLIAPQPSTINKLPTQKQSQQQSLTSEKQSSQQQSPRSPPSATATAPAPAPQSTALPVGGPSSPGDGGGGGGLGEAPPVSLRPDTGVKIEFVLGLLAAGVLFGLWVFLMYKGTDCYEKEELIFWVKTFSLLGTIAGLFTSIYCCFERTISPARGFASCLYISFLAMVGGLNLVGAYVATTCICTCRDNAIRDEKKDDLLIFILELIGAILILGVILVASLTRPMV